MLYRREYMGLYMGQKSLWDLALYSTRDLDFLDVSESGTDSLLLLNM